MRSLPAEIERLLAARHRAAGVTFYFNRQAVGIRWTRDAVEVDLDDGTQLHGDAVLAAVGVTPRVELASSAGLAIDKGSLWTRRYAAAIRISSQLATPALYPTGCSALARLECWKSAEEQGEIAARNMLGGGEDMARVPWSWSDQYELSVQVAGGPACGHWVAVPPSGRGWPAGFPPSRRWQARLHQAAVGSAGTIGRDVRVAQLMIERGMRPRPEALANSTVRLKSLLVAKAA